MEMGKKGNKRKWKVISEKWGRKKESNKKIRKEKDKKGENKNKGKIKEKWNIKIKSPIVEPLLPLKVVANAAECNASVNIPFISVWMFVKSLLCSWFVLEISVTLASKSSMLVWKPS